MRHFPIFLNVHNQKIVVSGAGETAVAKLRLLLKTEAQVLVFGSDPHQQIVQWATANRLNLTPRPMKSGDADTATLLYAANDDAAEDARVAEIGRSVGALVNIVDNLEDSAFITPAIVDRDPVTVAIGTEGAAPVLARSIKADLEERLSASVGTLARIGQLFRKRAELVPQGRKRRNFWSKFYGGAGERALLEGGEPAVITALEDLLAESVSQDEQEGHVSLVGAGPGDPELMTLKARRLLHEADVVLHDRLVPAPILELARREAIVVDVGKKGYGPSWSQKDISDLMVEHALEGAQVVRLKSGDPAIFGRLDEELDALDEAGISWEIVPGITSASAAASSIGTSLTRRGRNSSLRVITGREAEGFAEHDWRSLAQSGAAAAIYMGARTARFIQGRLLMHGAEPSTPVCIVENASRHDQRIVEASLANLSERVLEENFQGPAILLYGLARRNAQRSVDALATAGAQHIDEAIGAV